jgi:hypothetical protein
MRTTTTTRNKDRDKEILERFLFVATVAAILWIKCLVDPA